jgi:hypothetical protein
MLCAYDLHRSARSPPSGRREELRTYCQVRRVRLKPPPCIPPEWEAALNGCFRVGLSRQRLSVQGRSEAVRSSSQRPGAAADSSGGKSDLAVRRDRPSAVTESYASKRAFGSRCGWSDCSTVGHSAKASVAPFFVTPTRARFHADVRPVPDVRCGFRQFRERRVNRAGWLRRRPRHCCQTSSSLRCGIG